MLKARTTVINRWLGEALHLGNLHEVSRTVAAWTRRGGGRPGKAIDQVQLSSAHELERKTPKP
jgi:hypothetical protein